MKINKSTFFIMVLLWLALFFVVYCVYCVGQIDGRIAEQKKFKMEQLKVVKPVQNFEEIIFRLNRIERALGIQP